MIRKAITLVLAAWLGACVTAKPARPVDAVLADLNGPPKPCRDEYNAEGWRPADPKQCAAEQVARRHALLAELKAAYEIQARNAPACVSSIHLPSLAFQNTGIDPSEPHAVASLIAHGYFVGSVLQIDGCAQAVCRWRSQFDAGHGSAYCESAHESARNDGHPL